MRRYVLPYKSYSGSAKALKEALGAKLLKLVNSRYKPCTSDLVINWGGSSYGPHPALQRGLLGLPRAYILNDPEDVARCCNKLSFFNLMQEAGCSDLIPQFWTDKKEIPNEEYPIVARTLLCSHSGNGISIGANVSDLPDAPLFVKYVKKKEEYRVHLGLLPGDDYPVVLDLQRKARELSNPDPNWQVRNRANGFVYARENLSVPDPVLGVAAKCFHKTGLDFGAVDVVWNEKQEKAYVLEINTAPGLHGSTVDSYVNFFDQYMQIMLDKYL